MRSFLIALVLVLITTAAPAQDRQAVARPGAAPNPNLSPAIKAGNVIYLSGMLGVNRDQPDTTIGGQTRRSLEALKSTLEAAGSTMDRITKCTVFLTSVADFQGMNEVYRTFFPRDPPARSTVVVAALVSPGAKVEIECIAVAAP